MLLFRKRKKVPVYLIGIEENGEKKIVCTKLRDGGKCDECNCPDSNADLCPMAQILPQGNKIIFDYFFPSNKEG